MLGSKRTIPFWRPKRQRLEVERALATTPQVAAKGMVGAQAVAVARARSRLAMASKTKARFVER